MRCHIPCTRSRISGIEGGGGDDQFGLPRPGWRARPGAPRHGRVLAQAPPGGPARACALLAIEKQMPARSPTQHAATAHFLSRNFRVFLEPGAFQDKKLDVEKQPHMCPELRCQPLHLPKVVFRGCRVASRRGGGARQEPPPPLDDALGAGVGICSSGGSGRGF